jgi:hypothetical protein
MPAPRPAVTGAGLFLLTVAAYWALGPQQTAYDYQLSQANNLLHGHLDLTEEHTRNLAVLERVLYDGQDFCLPSPDPRGPGPALEIEEPRFSTDCRTYMQHAFGPVFLLLPLVLVWGMAVDQTLVSVLISGLTAVLVFALARRFSDEPRTQVAMTVLVVFGTTLWWAGSNGSVWLFAHTTAVFFLFGAIYASLVLRSPLLAGALVGAAFLCRPTTALAGGFPLVALADQWLPGSLAGRTPWRRIRWGPLLRLAAGAAPFLLLAMTVNVLRFGDPLESGYRYGEQVHQVGLRDVYEHGLFALHYLTRHAAVFWEAMPVFADHGSYVWPSWAGLAAWATTPALFAGLFIHLGAHRRLGPATGLAIAAACAALVLVSAASGFGWARVELPQGLATLPLWAAVALAVLFAVRARDRLVLACWAAVLPIAFADWLFAATGWAQFGYRYALDFLPFLVLLVFVAMAPRARTAHLALIALAVAVNLWGVLWIYRFAPLELFGWTWVSF